MQRLGYVDLNPSGYKRIVDKEMRNEWEVEDVAVG